MSNQQDETTAGQLVPFDDDAAEQQIRHVWHEGRLWYSIVDVIAFLTGNQRPRKYWSDLKAKIQAEGNSELSEKIGQLKMPAADGKQRLTDAADTETLLRIIQSIPSPKAEPFKQWLAQVGAERLEEAENPELAADRMRQHYRALGYPDEWIDRRLQGIIVRDELTQEWRERGAEEGQQFAILTDILNHGTFDVTTAQHKAVKNLRARHNLRDSMTTLELALTILAEETAKELHQVRESQGFGELRRDTGEAGEVGGAARRDIEQRTGRPVVSSENYKTLTARERQPQLFDDDSSKL